MFFEHINLLPLIINIYSSFINVKLHRDTIFLTFASNKFVKSDLVNSNIHSLEFFINF